MRTEKLEEFVRPFYALKDPMHDLTHVRRFLKAARSIAISHHCDGEILTYAAYFHGVDRVSNKAALIGFLRAQGLSRDEATRVLDVSLESHKGSRPKSTEGKVLHDAHLLEGGGAFMVAKSIGTGIARGNSLRQIADYYERETDRKFYCCFTENRRAYARNQRYAREFFRSLKASL